MTQPLSELLMTVLDDIADGKKPSPLDRENLRLGMLDIDRVRYATGDWINSSGGVKSDFIAFPFSPIVSQVLAEDKATYDIVLPPGFNHILVMGMVLSSDTGTGAYTLAHFNGDTGANYSVQRLSGSGATASAGYDGAYTAIHVGTAAESGAAAGESGFFVCFIPHYRSPDFYKSVIALEGVFTTPSGKGAAIWSSQWRGTSILTDISFFVSSPGNIKTGSLISVYGML